jgi:hypothetical protein
MRAQATEKPRCSDQNQAVETAGFAPLVDTSRHATGEGIEGVLASRITRTEAVDTAARRFDPPGSIRYLLVFFETIVRSYQHLELVQHALPLPREEARA